MLITLSKSQEKSLRQMSYSIGCGTEEVIRRSLSLLKVCLEEQNKGLKIASTRHHSIRKIINV